MANPRFLADNRGPLSKEERESIGKELTNRPGQRGEDSDYLTARIARDRPDVLTRMRAGEFRSVRQAALEAGIVKARWSAPSEPAALARAIKRRLREG